MWPAETEDMVSPLCLVCVCVCMCGGGGGGMSLKLKMAISEYFTIRIRCRTEYLTFLTVDVV